MMVLIRDSASEEVTFWFPRLRWIEFKLESLELRGFLVCGAVVGFLPGFRLTGCVVARGTLGRLIVTLKP
jgi:hypothetical protein